MVSDVVQRGRHRLERSNSHLRNDRLAGDDEAKLPLAGSVTIAAVRR